MKRFFVYLILTLPLVASTALAQITVDPPNPKAYRDIRVKATGPALGADLDGRPDRFDPESTQVSMMGNKITVSPLMLGATDFGGVPSPPLDQIIGAFPPGDYQLEVVKRATGRGSPGRVGGTIEITIPAPGSTEPYVDYTDLWWVPSESGWGLGIFHHPSNQVFATLYVYGSDGKPTWYVVPSGQFVRPTEYRGLIYKTTGPYFGGAFNSSLVSVFPAGAAILAFDPYDSNKGIVSFVIDGVLFEKAIVRQSF